MDVEAIYTALEKKYGEEKLARLRAKAMQNHPELIAGDLWMSWLVEYVMESIFELFEEFEIEDDDSDDSEEG